MPAAMTYGSYNFLTAGPIPQVGVETRVERPAGGATYGTKRATLVGWFNEGTYAANQTKVAALTTALQQDGKVLTWNDGTNAIINGVTARVVSFTLPPEWGAYTVNYTVVFEYVDLTVEDNITLTASIGGYTFPEPPSFGRRYAFVRKSAQASPNYITCSVTVSGVFKKGTIALNQAELETMQTAIKSGSVTLVYGSFTQTVRVTDLTASDSWTLDILPWTIQCEYDLPTGSSFPSNIIDQDSSVQTSPPYRRTAYHDVPYVNGRTTQDLGISHYTVTYSGYIVGVALSDALTAMAAILAVPLAAGGIREGGGSYTSKASQNRVDYNFTYSFNSAAAVAAAYPSY